MTADIIDHPGGRRRPDDRPQTEKSPARFWLKHDVKAFAFETATVDAEGAGALILLRGRYFITGCLPNTDAECAKVCRLGARKFARLRPWLFSFFPDGRNSELDATIEETERIIANKRDAGRRGGLGKALATARQNSRQSELQSDLDKQQEQLPPTSTPPTPPPASNPEPRAREAQSLLDEAMQGLTISQRATMGRLGLSRWIEDQLTHGIEPVDIAVGLGSAIRTLNGNVPTSPRYFEQPIRRAREERLRPLPDAGAISLDGFARQLETELGLRRGALAERGIDLRDAHQQFVSKASGWSDVVTFIREVTRDEK